MCLTWKILIKVVFYPVSILLPLFLVIMTLFPVEHLRLSVLQKHLPAKGW